MIPLRAYAGRRVCVVALTGSGLAAARALAAGEAQVTVWDGDPVRRDRAEQAGLVVEDPTTRDWSGLAALICGDAALGSDDPAPRLIELARATEIAVHSAETLFAEGFAAVEGARFIAGLGRQAGVALHLAAHMLRQAGRPVIGPELDAPVRTPRPGSILFAAFDAPPRANPSGICLLDGAGGGLEVRRITEQAAGPVVLSADDPSARRLSMSTGRRAILVSGRSTLSRGVFVAAGRLFDAIDGRARRVMDLHEAPGLSLSHPLSVAAGYALARALGLSFDDAREVIPAYPGCAGQGALIGALGPLAVSDWSAAVTPRGVVDALTKSGPVIWLAGSSVDPDLPALLEASGTLPTAAVLTGDRRRARRKLAAFCPVHVERDLGGALARAVHAALKAGPDACIVYAPGGPAADGAIDRLKSALDGLLDRARQGDAA